MKPKMNDLVQQAIPLVTRILDTAKEERDEETAAAVARREQRDQREAWNRDAREVACTLFARQPRDPNDAAARAIARTAAAAADELALYRAACKERLAIRAAEFVAGTYEAPIDDSQKGN
jgi:hypothetical protein